MKGVDERNDVLNPNIFFLKQIFESSRIHDFPVICTYQFANVASRRDDRNSIPIQLTAMNLLVLYESVHFETGCLVYLVN